jgi:hypothetical protein
MQIRVEGADVLRRNLRRVHKDLPKGMRLIHAEISGPVAALARSRARRLSGRLAGSIRVRATTTMARIEAGRGLEYGGVQHWGWPGHNIEPDLFLTEAITEREAATIQLYERKLDEWVESVWRST